MRLLRMAVSIVRMSHDPASSAQVARLYERFGTVEARDVSPVYEALALGVAGDSAVRDLIAELPAPKRQPNLVFSASLHLGAPVNDYGRWRDWLLRRWDRVRPVILERSIQTNEAARCATLLPALTAIDGPIALLEVGASAGLCLYPDRYSYAYTGPSGTARRDPDSGPSPVVLECELRGAEAPQRLPRIAWRAGVDRNPLDATDADTRAWLESLVWPGNEDRRERIARAAAIAAEDPPRLVAADLNEVLPDLAATAPADAHLVVFHSAALVYLSTEERARFRRTVEELDCTWVSNEGAAVFPDIAARLPEGVDADGRFVLAVDGVPTALTSPHGRYYESFPGAASAAGGESRSSDAASPS
jgi:hypothetical protein